MKRNNFWQRPAPLPGQFIRKPNESDKVNSVAFFGERPSIPKKIFVLRRTSRLTETNGPVKIVQRVLMFDDHPDSLRLILGPSADPRPYARSGDRDILWDFILPGIAILVGVIAMLWLLL
jgi:hypothetical protein